MILAVPPETWPALQALGAGEDVEATVIGHFEATGRLRLNYRGQEVANLDLHFLHDGRPKVVRRAEWPPVGQAARLPSATQASGPLALRGRSPVMTAADRANLEMVDRLIAQEALWSPPLIDAFRQTPRHRFLERVFQHGRDGSWREVDVTPLGPSEIALVYSDRALTTRLSPAAGEATPVAISSSSRYRPARSVDGTLTERSPLVRS
jgi:hypothetical protein